jgi:hypothetical protein
VACVQGGVGADQGGAWTGHGARPALLVPKPWTQCSQQARLLLAHCSPQHETSRLRHTSQHVTLTSHVTRHTQDYEIDFISLSYTRSVDDVVEARTFLDAVGLHNTKIFAKLESRQVRCCVTSVKYWCASVCACVCCCCAGFRAVPRCFQRLTFASPLVTHHTRHANLTHSLMTEPAELQGHPERGRRHHHQQVCLGVMCNAVARV